MVKILQVLIDSVYCRVDMTKAFIPLFYLLLFSCLLQAQVRVDNVTQIEELLSKIEGEGVEISNFRVRGDLRQTGTFSDQAGILGVRNGMVLATGDVSYIGGSNAPFSNFDLNVSTTFGSTLQDAILDEVASGENYFDAVIIEFDIIPKGSKLSFNYVMASEEYIEDDEDFPDFFGFWFSGPGIPGNVNLARIPNSNLAVSTATVNDKVNNEFYNNNGTGSTPLINSLFGYDGYTDVFTAEADVVPCESYHLIMAIADSRDSLKDAAVFIEEGSLNSSVDPVLLVEYESRFDTIYEGCADAEVTVDVANNLRYDLELIVEYGGTVDQDDFEPLISRIVIGPNSDGLSFDLNAIVDSLEEGTEELTISLKPLCDIDFEIDKLIIPIKDELQLRVPDVRFCNEDTIPLGFFSAELDSLIFQLSDLLSCLDCSEPLVYRTDTDTIEYEFFEKATGCSYKDTFRIKEFEPFVEYSLDTSKQYTVLDIVTSIDSSNMDRFEWDFRSQINGEFAEVLTGEKVIFQSGFLNLEQTCSDIRLTTFNEEFACTEVYDTVHCINDKFIIPNIITPNSDGVNDFFTLKGICPGFWSLALTNRNGKEIFRDDTYDFDFEAKDVSDGLYYYFIQNQNQDRTFKGWLQIVR